MDTATDSIVSPVKAADLATTSSTDSLSITAPLPVTMGGTVKLETTPKSQWSMGHLIFGILFGLIGFILFRMWKAPGGIESFIPFATGADVALAPYQNLSAPSPLSVVAETPARARAVDVAPQKDLKPAGNPSAILGGNSSKTVDDSPVSVAPIASKPKEGSPPSGMLPATDLPDSEFDTLPLPEDAAQQTRALLEASQLPSMQSIPVPRRDLVFDFRPSVPIPPPPTDTIFGIPTHYKVPVNPRGLCDI